MNVSLFYQSNFLNAKKRLNIYIRIYKNQDKNR